MNQRSEMRFAIPTEKALIGTVVHCEGAQHRVVEVLQAWAYTDQGQPSFTRVATVPIQAESRASA